MIQPRHTLTTGTLAAFTCVLVVLTGCPYMGDSGNPPPASSNPQQEYDRGFAAGFARDDWYWDGYFDGYYTMGATPIYYDDSGIPYLESPPYDAGYWDGVWYAYNDGYFVDYHYAFIIGFSEGYDNAYWPDYLSFLAADRHVEFYHGGWIDGYHDGYSEGRVFGANDYEQGLAFDWLDALLDYEAGVDLYFEEVDVGTGAWGPVTLYEYGTDPLGRKRVPSRTVPNVRMVIRDKEKIAGKALLGDLYRPIREDARKELNVTPSESVRTSSHPLRLGTSWYNRVMAYHSVSGKARTVMMRARTVSADTTD